MKPFLAAVATLVGATVGAGVLGIPYVVSQSGFWTGMAVIVALGIATLILNLYMGEVVLRTEGNHQISGYAEKYTGKPGKLLAGAFMIFGIYGALVAYMIGIGNAASAALGGNHILYSLAFLAIGSLVVIRGIKSLGLAELLITSLMVAVVMLIPLFSASNLQITNLHGWDTQKLMVPFGVVLFAFMGSAAIPEMREELGRNRKQLRKAIIIGTLIPLVIYILFAAVVVGLVGDGFSSLKEDERIATIALKLFVQPEIALLANLFAVITMTTSFMALAYALRGTLQYDFKANKKAAIAATLLVPLAIFLIDALAADITSFIGILGTVGAVTGGVTGILIVAMHWKAAKSKGRKPEFSLKPNIAIAAALILIFAAGIINELRHFL